MFLLCCLGHKKIWKTPLFLSVIISKGLSACWDVCVILTGEQPSLPSKTLQLEPPKGLKASSLAPPTHVTFDIPPLENVYT